MSFAFVYAFLLLPLPFLVRFLPPMKSETGLGGPAHLVEAITPSHSLQSDRLSLILLIIGWLSLVVSVALPQVSKTSDLLTASGRDIVLALDLSGSMEKEDFFFDGKPLSRLDAVKKTASAFVEARRGDRIGLLIFADRSYFAQPLTFDVGSVASAIREAQIGITGRSTAISDGLGLAIKRLEKSQAKSRVIVLLSDGVDTTGTVKVTDAARLAAEKGLRIHTIALGPEDMETVTNARDAVDSKTLREMAEAGNGINFRVRSMEDLEGMAKTLDEMEPNPSKRPPLHYQQPLWQWPASLALFVIVIVGWRRR